MYATIAVGTDGSETASIAERVALELARTSAGRVLFLSVYEDEPGMERSAGIVKAADREAAVEGAVAAAVSEREARRADRVAKANGGATAEPAAAAGPSAASSRSSRRSR